MGCMSSRRRFNRRKEMEDPTRLFSRKKATYPNLIFNYHVFDWNKSFPRFFHKEITRTFFSPSVFPRPCLVDWGGSCKLLIRHGSEACCISGPRGPRRGNILRQGTVRFTLRKLKRAPETRSCQKESRLQTTNFPGASC